MEESSEVTSNAALHALPLPDSPTLCFLAVSSVKGRNKNSSDGEEEVGEGRGREMGLLEGDEA